MNKEYISRLIFEYNPHHQGHQIEVPEFRRELHSELMKWLKKPQIIGIVGLRRTGKTTLMRQLMSELKEKAAYFSFDEMETHSKDVLVFVIDYIISNLGSQFIFLDEIHYVDDWEGVLKRYYDQKGIKFFVSGSESFKVSKSKTALTGRLHVFRLNTLSFREYLGLKGTTVKDRVEAPNELDGWEDVFHRLSTRREQLEAQFLDYLFKGAFPELVPEDDDKIIQSYIRDMVVRKVIFSDLPAIFVIKRKNLLFELFRYSCDNSAGLFEISKLATILGADQGTIKEYLLYLQNAFLLTISESYSRSPASRMKRNKKVHVAHPSIAMAVLGYDRRMLTEKILGQYVESVFADMLFWRDKHQNEVDVVEMRDGSPFPIEVKYRTHIHSSDLKGILRFMDKYDVTEGIVVTKETFEIKEKSGRRILLVPAWFHLLMR